MSAEAKALRPTETPPGYGDLTDDPIEALRRLSIFRPLTESEIEKIGAIAKVVRVPQDRVVPRGGEGGAKEAYCFVLKGQVAFAEFEQGKVPEEPKNKKKRLPPTMQVAKRIISLFDADDFFTNAHVPYARGEDGNKYDMALFTCVNVVLLEIPKAELDAILEKTPKLKEAVEIRGEESYYRQTLLKLDDRAEIFDFYVREGFEYAQAIKVIQTDKCIDCDECVKACSDRHGISRIERFGPRIGLIQFTLNCRTCEDARCITVCNFDAIGYDEDSEVIVYDNCVGCTLCAKACPHEAIRMVDIKGDAPPEPEEKPKTVIAKGEEDAKEKKRKKAKRIANKCDHCFGYADMACISACPTGAIIQIDPRALFRRDGGLVARAQKYFEPAPFEHGYSQTSRTQGVVGMLLLFGAATIGVFLCGLEYYARKLDPSLSVWAAFVGLTQGAAARASVTLTYSAVAGFGRWMGYFGAGMMILSALYTLRLHLPGLRRIGNSKTWFDFHVVFGLAGPILVLIHTDMNVMNPLDRPDVVPLFWCVTAIVATGLIGRYLYTLIPKLEASTERERKKLDAGIQAVADQWAAMTMSANVLAQFLKAQEKTASARSAPESTSVLEFIRFSIASELQRLSATLSLRFKTMGKMRNKKLRRATLKLMNRRSVIERRMQFYGLAKRLLAQWRGIHIAISILMFVLLSFHVAISVYAVGW
jgi:Fe-S-cluster-containing hydrogenase component 2